MLPELLTRTVAFLRQYVVVGDDELVALALWVAHTHAFEAADATPYLSITSAEKESGKTRLLEALEMVVATPWLTGRVTVPVLSRKIDAESPTLLLDESDTAFKGDKDYAVALIGILNSGYRRGGKTSVCVGQGGTITYKDLSCFSCKAIAGIGRLPDTVASRSIPIRLKRRAPGEQVQRFRRRAVLEIAEPLQIGFESWAGQAVDLLAEDRPEIPDALGDRAADCWEPLLAIADRAGGEWPAAARRAAVNLAAGTLDVDDSTGVLLLADIKHVFEQRDQDRMSTAQLLEALNALDESPWGGWSKGLGLKARSLATLLKPYAIKSEQVWLAAEGKNHHGYKLERFEDAFARYLGSQTLEPLEPASVNGSRPVHQTLERDAPSVSENGSNPHEQTDLASLAFGRGA